MRRADRLFRIVEYLKARRDVVKAEDLAQLLEVSQRTIYRDIADLSMSGVPIIGEAGVGYILDRDHIIRPLMFSVGELEALMLGAQMVESWSDKDLGQSAHSALDKIKSVVPHSLLDLMNETALFALPSVHQHTLNVDFQSLRKAIRYRHYINFDYLSLDNELTQREIRPLALAFFAPVWIVLGWCETRHDFRNFRLDRMNDMRVSNARFKQEKGKTLKDYQKTLGK